MYGKGKKIQDADDKGEAGGTGGSKVQEEKAEETAEKTAGTETKGSPASPQTTEKPGDSGMFSAPEVHGRELKDMHTRHEKERRDMHTRHEGEHGAMMKKHAKEVDAGSTGASKGPEKVDGTAGAEAGT
jgi:hypothetical protein